MHSAHLMSVSLWDAVVVGPEVGGCHDEVHVEVCVIIFLKILWYYLQI